MEHAEKLSSAAALVAATANSVRANYTMKREDGEEIDTKRLERLANDPELAASLPSLSIPSIANNLRKLNTRSKALWSVQYQVAKMLSWQQPAFTLSLLGIYTFICLHPYLAAVIPLVSFILTVMVPGFDQRHPREVMLYPKDKPMRREFDEMADYTPELRPAERLTQADRDLIMVLRQLQQSLAHIIEALENMDKFIYKAGSFVDESYSSALFIVMTLALPLIAYGASFVPLKGFAIANGWIIVGLCHPKMKSRAKELHHEYWEGRDDVMQLMVDRIREKDIVLDEEPEEREVEIFELQRQGLTPRMWDPWVYTPAVYTLNSPYRISSTRPPGCRFLEDVQPPEGWTFDDELPWQVDCGTKLWVKDRGIRNVEVDVDHFWAFDYINGKRGEWRRRRWVRKCFRKAADPLPV
ncbi:hypothetical protein TRVA0_003S01376 [Trichomonascus vanleenenianus]|uniref:PEX28-32 family peroxisomal membrane protein n=1 Tax=Trichomonascus vanleenenianus TaxID=2268995 RepID=UPI003EC98CBF